MTTQDFITELFCKVDDQMKDVPKHTQASLWPSELVRLRRIGMLHAIKGVGNRAFYRWLTKDFHPLFPNLPHPPQADCFGCSRLTRTGPTTSWSLPLCWASLTAMASS